MCEFIGFTHEFIFAFNWIRRRATQFYKTFTRTKWKRISNLKEQYWTWALLVFTETHHSSIIGGKKTFFFFIWNRIFILWYISSSSRRNGTKSEFEYLFACWSWESMRIHVMLVNTIPFIWPTVFVHYNVWKFVLWISLHICGFHSSCYCMSNIIHIIRYFMKTSFECV